MNRFAWDLRYGAPQADQSAAEEGGADEFGRTAQGPQVLPGIYQARLTVAGRTYAQPFQVTLDPRSTATAVELRKQLDLCLAISLDMAKAADAAREGRTLRRLLAERRQSAQGEIAARIAALDADAAKIVGSNLGSVTRLLGAALGVAESADRTPPGSAYEIFQQAGRDLTALLTSWKSLRDTELARLNQELQQNKLPPIHL
jgi:hypothetical protein